MFYPLIELTFSSISLIFAFYLAVSYLELWKRYSSILIHRWGLTDYTTHGEYPRAQYLSMIRRHPTIASQMDKEHVIEPYVPFWYIKFLPTFTSYSVVLLFVSKLLSIMLLFDFVILYLNFLQI